MKRTEKYRKIPQGLKHKPIYVINGYDQADGFYKNDTDVISLSLGKAQWSMSEFVPSVKVWRDVRNNKTGEYKISRQSEETTLTRAIDLALLVVKVYDGYANKRRIDGNITSTIFGNLQIEVVGDKRLLTDLREYFNENNIVDLKNHIRLLKENINKIKL